MTYVEALAGVFWAWQHGGAALPLKGWEHLQPWATERDLSIALKKAARDLRPQYIPVTHDDNALARDVSITEDERYIIALISPDPAKGRALGLRALSETWSVDDDWLLMMSYDTGYVFLLLLAIHCHEYHHPGADIPLTNDNIENICSIIQETIHCGGPMDPASLADIAWPLALLTPEGRAIDRANQRSIPRTLQALMA